MALHRQHAKTVSFIDRTGEPRVPVVSRMHGGFGLATCTPNRFSPSRLVTLDVRGRTRPRLIDLDCRFGIHAVPCAAVPVLNSLPPGPRCTWTSTATSRRMGRLHATSPPPPSTPTATPHLQRRGTGRHRAGLELRRRGLRPLQHQRHHRRPRQLRQRRGPAGRHRRRRPGTAAEAASAYVDAFTNSAPNVSFVFPANLGNGRPLRRRRRVARGRPRVRAGPPEPVRRHGTEPRILLRPGRWHRARSWAPATRHAQPVVVRHLRVSATTFQDDMAVIAGPANGFGFRTDDHGNTAASATPLTSPPVGPSATRA